MVPGVLRKLGKLPAMWPHLFNSVQVCFNKSVKQMGHNQSLFSPREVYPKPSKQKGRPIQVEMVPANLHLPRVDCGSNVSPAPLALQTARCFASEPAPRLLPN